MSFDRFYAKLESSLAKSTATDHKVWASQIVTNSYDLQKLSSLLHCSPRIATRFSWLLSQVGEVDSNYLLQELPYLLKFSKSITHIKFNESFAMYWLIAGVPEENEAEAIQILFDWMLEPALTVTNRSRSLFVLEKLTQKHPELKNELILCIQDQMDKNTADFSKRANKVLARL